MQDLSFSHSLNFDLPQGKEAVLTYSEKDIQAAVQKVATEINLWISSESTPCIAVPLMDGAMQFAAALTRALPSDLEVHSIRTKAYGKKTTTTGVTVFMPLPVVQDKRVLLIEDLVDTGTTLEKVTEIFMTSGATEVAIASLLNRVKPERKIQPDFCGLQFHGDEWLIGFGLDYQGKYRSLPMIFRVVDSLDGLSKAPESA